jgi:hypothetical protein
MWIIVTSAPYNDDRNIREDLKRPGGRTHFGVLQIIAGDSGPGAFPERLIRKIGAERLFWLYRGGGRG